MADALADGDRAPDVRLPSTLGDVSLAGLLAGGKRLVLAFYTEDGTPSCETEIAMLRDAYEAIREHDADVLAISADSVASHRAFAEHIGGVPFALAADTSLAAARAYGVVAQDGSNRARRAAFVIDAAGTVVLAMPHLQPNNVAQFESILRALGMDI